LCADRRAWPTALTRALAEQLLRAFAFLLVYGDSQPV